MNDSNARATSLRCIAIRPRTSAARVADGGIAERADAIDQRERASASPAIAAASAAATSRRARAAASARQLGRSLERRRGRSVAAAGMRAVGGALELGGHLVVGAEDRGRAVPRAAVGVLVAA